MKGKLFAGICLLTLASLAGQSGRDAVDAAYAFYLEEPDRIWADDASFVEAVYGGDFVRCPPADSVVFSHVKTGDRNADMAAALKLREMLQPGDVIVSVLTNDFFARVYSGDVLNLGRPRVLGPLPGSGKLWEGDCANLLFNYDWEEFALATGEKSGPSFRLVRPVLSARCRLAARRRHPAGREAPIADERVRGLIETAYALYLKGTAAQYCYFKFCDEALLPDDPKDYSWTRTSRWLPIEECTPDRTFFSVCSSFPIEMYYNATGLRLRRDEPGSITHFLHVPEDFVVYRYDVRSSSEPVESAVAKIRSLIEPGDVITGISLPGNGHTMMYIGKVDGHDKAMHGTGRNYDGHPKYLLDRQVEYVPSGGKEVFELDGSICCDDIDALMFTPGHYEYLGHFKQLLLWRPFKRSSLTLTATAKARLKHPRLRYDRRVEGGIFGAVVSGGELG